MDIKKIIESRMGENYSLHYQYINRTLVQVQRIIGFDKIYTRAQGAYLFDKEGNRYLDFLGGFGVFAVGRNNPKVKKVIEEVLDLDLPNMVQMDSALLSGLLAEALVKRFEACGASHLNAIFICNSGTEAVEGAIKFARAATRRPRILSLTNSFHGLSMGSLSVSANPYFHEGFGPFLPGCEHVVMGDLNGLEHELKKGDVAAFLFEPVQGKGIYFPRDNYFEEAQKLCRKYGTLLISDEVQTGLGRTGKWFGFEHWNLEPDIVTLAKALSGGYVPCGAIATRREIYQKVFNRLDRCIVHSSTFGRNNLACACGLATLSILEENNLIENSKNCGEKIETALIGLQKKYDWIKEVRVKGLMIAIEFGEPKSITGKMAWKTIHSMDKGLFPQLIVSTLMSEHRILSQVAANNLDIVKCLPPLIIGDEEINYFITSLESVLEELKKFPGPLWNLGTNFLKAMRAQKTDG
ncbi:aminotransferase [Methylacidiphilum kamchatkense Kam1]|uniref:Aminotransferase n=1 Tax=Methylacidiphilum kamchatkense Kam1 TaxID=1202785 RepID=A0A0C1UPQ4_9BACT|nr:aspartate aminotransferase family protein [Methylacidiphilum kamchatkense]KIE58384.1 aminotransferase [Methylacidiphilum kamchatkense Kam1]QDQ42209.1 ornithine--oxo-acid transaminase [Methylacidiphilum kamchatkense Kam1]